MALKLPHKYLHHWLGGYLAALARRSLSRRHSGTRHLLFALCDHYEPLWGGADVARGRARVERWRLGYPQLAERFSDADGQPPKHSFFFPGEQYQPEFLDDLAQLCRRGFGEVEVHLHHDGDSAEKLTDDLLGYLEAYARHGHLTRDSAGRVRYGFIHGNWCLANSRRDQRYCGVDSELRVLFDTGCYADFTFPSAPDETQFNIVNQIYWPGGDPEQARAHELGLRARVGHALHDRILMIQGPLAIARRPGRLSWRLESAALTARDPASRARLATWVAQNIQIAGRPDWSFVKVHTHGAPEEQAEALLGEPGRELHRLLASEYNDGKRFALHYVTAREMYNIALAGMQGQSGDPSQYRDYLLGKPPVAA